MPVPLAPAVTVIQLLALMADQLHFAVTWKLPEPPSCWKDAEAGRIEGGGQAAIAQGENCVTPAYSIQLACPSTALTPCGLQVVPSLRQRVSPLKPFPFSSLLRKCSRIVAL